MYDAGDEPGIPVSGGIPPIIYISGVVGVVMILIIIALVFASSSANHIWPSADSASVPLK